MSLGDAAKPADDKKIKKFSNQKSPFIKQTPRSKFWRSKHVLRPLARQMTAESPKFALRCDGVSLENIYQNHMVTLC